MILTPNLKIYENLNKIRNQKIRSTSYRRNHYINHFEWTYELNRDIYQCYLKTHQIPTIGYMKHMKNYWDELHPELSYFSEKQLRQQASFVKSKGLVLDTNLETTNQPEEIDNASTDIVIQYQTKIGKTLIIKLWKMSAILNLILIKLY